MATAALERSEIAIFSLAAAGMVGIGLLFGHNIGYNRGQQEARDTMIGVEVPEGAVCGLMGTIHLPKLPKQSNPETDQTDMNVTIYGETIKVDPKGNLFGNFHIGPDRRPFLLVDADREGKRNDRIQVDHENGVLKYKIECVKEPTPTPTPKEPATPTPLSSQHDRLIAYRGGFNGTKPAGRGGKIFRGRG